MKIYTSLENISIKNAVVSVGTFDGLHEGHLEILKTMNEIAHQFGNETLIFTFDPHPRSVLSPEYEDLKLLSTKAEKTELIRFLGIDHLVFYPFTKEFSSLKFLDFVKQILIEKLNVSHLVLGFDNHFGKGREGNFETLVKHIDELKIGLTKVDALLHQNQKISSSEIRQAVMNGEIEKANLHLRYDYSLTGTVVTGKQLGRTIGFPTANIEPDASKLIPGFGVYAVIVEFNGLRYNGMLNIGVKPTVDKIAAKPTIEVNIFDFQEEIYGKELKVTFIKKIRNEVKFSGLPQLIEQLNADRENVKQLLTNRMF